MKKQSKIVLIFSLFALIATVFLSTPQTAQASSSTQEERRDELTQERLEILLELENAARAHYQEKIDTGQTPSVNDPQACTWKLTEPTKENRLASIMEVPIDGDDISFLIFTTLVCENKKGETLAQATYRRYRANFLGVGSSDEFAKNTADVEGLAKDYLYLEGELFSFYDHTTSEWKSYTAGPAVSYDDENEKFGYRVEQTGITVHPSIIPRSGTTHCEQNEWVLQVEDLFVFFQDNREVKSPFDFGQWTREE